MTIRRSDTRLTDDRIRRYEAEGYWCVPTFPELLQRNARECPHKVGYSDERGSITWGELWRRSMRLAGHLLDLGVRPGDVVGIQLPNRIEFVVALGAVNAVGAIACPQATALRSAEVERILGFSNAVLNIVARTDKTGFDYLAMLAKLKGSLADLQRVIVVDTDEADLPPWALSYESLMTRDSAGSELEKRLASAAPGVHDVNRVLFTSGSTGDPKAVLHTYASSIFSNYQINEHLRVGPDSVLLLFIPITLNWGLFQVIQTAVAQCRLILQQEFVAERLLRTVAKEQVTHLGGPPTAIVAILNSLAAEHPNLSSLQCYVTSGSSCPISLLRQVRREIGCSIIEGYGMTESGWIAATGQEDDPEATVGSVGRPFPGMEIRLLERDADADVPPGEPGEIAMRGPSVCVGYYRNEELNRAVWTADDWFRSGDLGYLDPAGRLRIVGRSKDLIKHGGSSIFPREIEELLLVHPKVADVAVVGFADSYFGENVCACVVVRPGQQFNLAEVIAFLRDKVARYKLPQRLEFFERLPYTPTGKVQKHLIRVELDRRAEHGPDAPVVADLPKAQEAK